VRQLADDRRCMRAPPAHPPTPCSPAQDKMCHYMQVPRGAVGAQRVVAFHTTLPAPAPAPAPAHSLPSQGRLHPEVDSQRTVGPGFRLEAGRGVPGRTHFVWAARVRTRASPPAHRHTAHGTRASPPARRHTRTSCLLQASSSLIALTTESVIAEARQPRSPRCPSRPPSRRVSRVACRVSRVACRVSRVACPSSVCVRCVRCAYRPRPEEMVTGNLDTGSLVSAVSTLVLHRCVVCVCVCVCGVCVCVCVCVWCV
jgi:hypothetical protein